MCKIMKLFISIACVILLINYIYIQNYNVKALTFSDMQSRGNDFLGRGSDVGGAGSTVSTDLSGIAGFLKSIGVGLIIIAIAVTGIRYLLSGAEGKGKQKEQLIGVVVAGIVIFGAYSIWSISIDLFSKF